MSYCRFSSDDFQCDVYVYEDCSGGYTTHVASGKHVFKEEIPPVVSYFDNHDAWIERHRKVMALIDSAKLQPIGLEFDGQSFNDETAEDTIDRLEMLKDAGYRVPKYAIDALREEANAV